MPRIVVFGANGFIGKHIVRRLAENTSNTIVAFDRFSAQKMGKEYPFIEYKNVENVTGDFFNSTDVKAVLSGADYVFHLVSSTNPAKSDQDPFIDIETNVRNSINLLNACVESNTKKIIFLSSGGAVYGTTDHGNLSEDTAPNPVSPYGIGKLAIEHYLNYYHATHGLDYVIYRVANPYGPGQNIYGRQGVIPIFMHHFFTNTPITIYGDGTMSRDYIYIDDLIDMIIGTYDKKTNYRIYNLGSGTSTTVNDIIKGIEECSQTKVPKEYTDSPASFVHDYMLSIDRFTSEFGIVSKTDFNDGIRKTWNYVRAIK